MRKKITNNQGFTLLEIAVAVFIVSFGIVGVLALIHYNMQAEQVSKRQLVASQLAQEGLELVRNRRDNNWLNDLAWGEGITNLSDNNFIVDYEGSFDESVDSLNEDGAKLYLNPQGFYDHQGSTSTPYSRIINIKDIESDNFTLESTVQWSDQKGTHKYKAETELYDWR